MNIDDINFINKMNEMRINNIDLDDDEHYLNQTTKNLYKTSKFPYFLPNIYLFSKKIYHLLKTNIFIDELYKFFMDCNLGLLGNRLCGVLYQERIIRIMKNNMIKINEKKNIVMFIYQYVNSYIIGRKIRNEMRRRDEFIIELTEKIKILEKNNEKIEELTKRIEIIDKLKSHTIKKD